MNRVIQIIAALGADLCDFLFGQMDLCRGINYECAM